MRSRRRIFSLIAWILVAAMTGGSYVLVPFAASMQQSEQVHSSSDAPEETHSPSDLEEPLVDDLDLKMIQPTIVDIDSWEMLTEWYQDAADSGKEAFGRLTADIYVDGSWSMEESGSYITLETGSYTIKVPEGASFTVDNPRLYLMGAGPVLQVMMGGTAAVMQGTLQSLSPNGVAILSYAPANLTIGERASVGTVLYVNDGVTEVPPQTMEREILNVFASSAVSMTVGEQLPLPENVKIQVMSFAAGSGSHEALRIPVQWQIEDIDFEVPGEKIISGVFAEEILEKLKLTNPKHLTGSIRVLVQEPGPIRQFSGQIIRIRENGDDRTAILQFGLPLLHKDVTGVYLEQSSDGIQWNRVDNVMGTEADPKNFLEQVQREETKGFLVYYAPVQGKQMWFRLEIQGSAQEGISNPVTLTIPEPDEKPEEKPEEDNGSSGGNRGGIGQEESDRVMPERDESGSGLFPGGVFSDRDPIEAGKHLISPIPVYAAAMETTEAVQPSEREKYKTEETSAGKLAKNKSVESGKAEPAGSEATGIASAGAKPAAPIPEERASSEPVTAEKPEDRNELAASDPVAVKPAYPPSAGAAVAALCAAAGILGFWLFRKK